MKEKKQKQTKPAKKEQQNLTPTIRRATVLFTKNRVPAQTIINYILTAEKNDIDILILGVVDPDGKETPVLEITMPKYAPAPQLLP